MEKNTEKHEIPLGKPARVGNYKLWRSGKQVGKGKNKYSIEQINVSSIDGDWQIKIPATVGMFSMIRDLYADGNDRMLEFFFNNMMYVSIVPNGYYHKAVDMVSTVFANPDLLNEEDEQHELLVDNVKALIKGFLEWRKEYDKIVSSSEPTDEEMMNDEVADEMMSSVDEIELQLSEKDTKQE